MGFFGVFYCQDSIKSSLKSSTILHFRNPKLNNFSYKASHLRRSTRASKLQFQPPPQPKRASYGPGQSCRWKCSAKVVAANAVPRLSLQMLCRSAEAVVANAVSKLSLRMQCQSRPFKVVAANAVPKLSLQMQCQSCRCKCSDKVIAANAVTKLSLQMQCQSCRCKCSDKVVTANAVPKLSLKTQCTLRN